MPSQDKLIKQGILLTDNLFDEIAKRLSRGVKASDTLEAFLNQTKDYTTNNPLVLNGYKDKMLELILQETNNHKFSRPAQRELTRATIEKRVGDRIVDVGEDIVQSVRDIVKWGYNNNKSQDEIADEITHRVEVIKNTRARTIARTEVARTATASDYVINKERGATHFTVDCRDTCCPVCRKDYNFGNVEYTIDQVEMLPPRHPNCYDRETKVYTINGWKYFKDLSDDDLLLSMNPKGNELEFIKPIRLIKYKNTDKKLYHIHNRWFDICVTEDHDCFIHQRRDGGSKGRYLEPQFRKPSELTSESKFIRCIDVDRENPKVVNINGLEFEPKDFAFFMAWFISEGSVLHNPETAKQHGYPVKITQEIGENREVLERELQRIFGYLGFRVAIGKSYFEVYSKQLYDYLLPLSYSNEKYIPSEVFTLNKECLNIFLDNYVLGDGHERVSDNELVQNSSERALFTSSPRLRDDLSYLVLLCGYYPSISLHTPKGKVSAHKNGTYVQNNTVFRIAVNKSKHTNYSGCTVDLIEYNDYVYCAELPKWHTLWVMRNGKTSWNGNCRCYARYSIKGGSGVKASKKPYPAQSSTGVREPTKEQLSNNLTAMERSKYANYKRLVDSHTKWLNDNPDASAKQIENHKKKLAAALVKLNELKAKALGGSVPASKPKTAPKPKAESKAEPKPKTGEKLPTPKRPAPKKTSAPKKPKSTSKPKTPKTTSPKNELQTPTKEQLDKNLNQKERKEYKDIEYEIKWANDILNKASSTDKQKAYAKTRLDAITPRFNELTNKALGLAPKRKRKSKSSTSKKKTKKTKELVQLDKPKNAILTKEECDSLTFEQLADHHNATYKGLVKIAEDNNKEYHVFEQTFANGETFKLHFEKSAVNAYNKEGVATANEIIHETFKVPEVLRKETNDIWFRNTQKTTAKNKKGSGFKSFANDEGGMNTHTNKRWYNMMKAMGKKVLNDPNHRIAINPKHFKKLKEFNDILNWRNRPEQCNKWKHAIHHEFNHSIDSSRDIWKNDKTELSSREEYLEIEKAEPDFTVYAHDSISEAYAEHGGYISYMLANPEEQSKKVKIVSFERDENGRRRHLTPTYEEITFAEYKKRYPKHYKYFTKLFKEGVKE